MPPADVAETMSARARRAVGEHKGNDWSLRPREHADELSPEAGALQRILGRPEIERIRSAYVDWNSKALKLQGRHKRWGKSGILAAMLATVVAVFLMISPFQLSPLASVIASSSVWLLLCVSWAYFVAMMIRRPLEAWYKARANAEEFRKRLFEAVLAATEAPQAAEIATLPLQLEYFRRYQFEVQKDYFGGKSRIFQRRAKISDRIGWLFAAVPFVALGLTLATGVSAAGEQGFLSSSVNWIAGGLHRIEALSIDVYGTGLALVVSALSAGMFAVAQLDNYRRNAARYANMLRRLDEMAVDPRLGFSHARAAADAGERAPVERLVREMHALMTSELGEWVTVGLYDNQVIDMPERTELPGAAYELKAGPDGVPHLVAVAKLTTAEFEGIRRAVSAPLLNARKIGFVAARVATEREKIFTHWNGKESADVAEPGDWVVTNMSAAREIMRDRDGNENTYVIRADVFPRLYDLDSGNEFGQLYKSKSVVEAFLLPGSFEILAPWGEIQRGARGYLLNNGQEVYGNNRDTFEATYEIVEDRERLI